MSKPPEQLWGISIQGPDDLIAAPDMRAAKTMAQRFNAKVIEYDEKGINYNDPVVWAVPIPWPYPARDHAANLARQGGVQYGWLFAGDRRLSHTTG